jgi:hypothetical protein
MKITGEKLTLEEFDNLQKGDVYFYSKAINGIRCFDRHSSQKSYCYDVDGNRHLLSDLRWLTKEKYNKFVKENPTIKINKPEEETKLFASITEEDFKTLKKGDLIFIKDFQIEIFEDFSLYNTAIISTGKEYSRKSIRFPTVEEIILYNSSKIEDNKMNTSGNAITLEEFDNLENGDLYRYKGKITQFVNHYTITNGIKKYAKNSDGTSYYYDNLFSWPTLEERNDYIKKNGEVKMSNLTQSKLNTAISTIKNDGTDALWRVAAKQAVKSAKTPIVAFLEQQRFSSSLVQVFASQLDTDNGEAALAFVLGSLIPYIPRFGSDVKFIRLAKELRILGMENLLSKVADVVLNPLRDQLVEILKSVNVDTNA